MKMNHYPDSQSLVEIAFEAGIIMDRHFKPNLTHELKDDQTPVTIADREINTMVIEWFKRHYPHITVIGEEATHVVADAEYVAVVDPIDGTHPYCHGLPISTFAACVLHQGRPLSAVIHDPWMKRVWWADHDTYCYINDRKQMAANVSTRNTLNDASAMIIGPAKPRYNIDGIVADFRNHGGKWTRTSSSCLFAGLVAAGNYDIVIAEGTKIWETAAMDLIVTKAGGKACHIDGTPLDYNRDLQGHIITNAALHDKVVELVQKYRP